MRLGSYTKFYVNLSNIQTSIYDTIEQNVPCCSMRANIFKMYSMFHKPKASARTWRTIVTEDDQYWRLVVQMFDPPCNCTLGHTKMIKDHRNIIPKEIYTPVLSPIRLYKWRVSIPKKISFWPIRDQCPKLCNTIWRQVITLIIGLNFISQM